MPSSIRRFCNAVFRVANVSNTPAENTFAATISAGVGSIKGVFNGTVRLEDLREPEHLRIVVDGKGSPGFLKGSGDLDLEPAENGTKVNYSAMFRLAGRSRAWANE